MNLKLQTHPPLCSCDICRWEAQQTILTNILEELGRLRADIATSSIAIQRTIEDKEKSSVA